MYPDVPRVAVGAVVLHENKVLLVLRGKAPAKDVWAIPGGRVHLGETLQDAAERETFEETGLLVQAGEVIYTFDAIEQDEVGKIRFHYVILDLEAKLVTDQQTITPGDDAQDARWFTLQEINHPELPISKPTRILLSKIMQKP